VVIVEVAVAVIMVIVVGVIPKSDFIQLRINFNGNKTANI